VSFQTSISFSGVGRSNPVERVVAARARSLGERFPEVKACRIAIEAPTPSLRACHARVTIATSADVFLIVESPRKDANEEGVFEVLERAFQAATVRLERRRTTHGLTSPTSTRSLGSAA
jgi:hypothetical protein